MPVTAFQREVLGVIAANRNEESHFAGGLVLNAATDSARFSHDFDIFHEAAADVARASDADVATLREAGYEVAPIRSVTGQSPTPSAKPASSAARSASRLIGPPMSAFRFFPVEKDPLLGCRLHLFDMATNKALTLRPALKRAITWTSSSCTASIRSPHRLGRVRQRPRL